MIKTKRIYEEPDPQDGLRVLVDRLWPRGLSRQRAQVDRWEKELAPSDELRRWFGHDPARWEEFRERYLEELKGRRPRLEEMEGIAAKGTVTLLFAARDTQLNNAVVVLELLERMRRS
ncbi:MAG TPA: hypothetical protein DCZ75_00810 [Geobacter sp.]|nr:hypothetical protein [Geobacter sp.]